MRSNERGSEGIWRARSFFGGAVDLLATRGPGELIRKAFRLWRSKGFRGLHRAGLDIISGGLSYPHWIRYCDSLAAQDRKLIQDHIDTFSRHPLISVVMPVHNTPAKWLARAIESVSRQLYPHWELCIADDASSQPHVRAILEDAQRSDSRIKVAYRSENGHISMASNTALELATGEFFALLDHDDELSEHALYMVALAVEEDPGLDLIYSDEDKIDDKGRRYSPYFKPDWNPDVFLGQNLISHLGVYRLSLVRSLGGFHQGVEGAQDWDLALRVTDASNASRIHHIPHVLYHWRAVSGSTAKKVDEKEYAVTAAREALLEYCRRNSIEAEVAPVVGGHFHIVYPMPDPLPLVSVIVPTRNGLAFLQRCLDGLFDNTDYAEMEIIVVDNCSDDPATLAYLDSLTASGSIRLLRYDAPFNYSAINNMAVRHANGELICLLNNDIEPIGENWLREMVSHAVRPGIGAVGAMLYYPDDTIQHAGIFLNGVAADHLYKGRQKGIAGDMNRARLVQNLSAVTAACLVVRKAIWEEVGGLDELCLPVAFNDVDFCLKVRECGYRNLWTPFAELYHHESVSRGHDDTPEKRARFESEVACLQERWGDVLRHDPALSPNHAFHSHWRLANPPRTQRPWRRSAEMGD